MVDDKYAIMGLYEAMCLGKKGYSKNAFARKSVSNVNFYHCPFCGKTHTTGDETKNWRKGRPDLLAYYNTHAAAYECYQKYIAASALYITIKKVTSYRFEVVVPK